MTNVSVSPLSAHRQQEWAVYFVHAPSVGRIKIGQTKFLARRVPELQAASPVPLVFLGWIPGGMKLERELHREFASALCHSEWFKTTEAVKAALTRFDVWIA